MLPRLVVEMQAPNRKWVMFEPPAVPQDVPKGAFELTHHGGKDGNVYIRARVFAPDISIIYSVPVPSRNGNCRVPWEDLDKIVLPLARLHKNGQSFTRLIRNFMKIDVMFRFTHYNI